MWRLAFESGHFSDFDSLLSLFSFEMCLYVHETQDRKVFQMIGEFLKKKRSENVHLFLHVNEKKIITESLQTAIFESLSNVATIRYNQLTLASTHNVFHNNSNQYFLSIIFDDKDYCETFGV